MNNKPKFRLYHVWLPYSHNGRKSERIAGEVSIPYSTPFGERKPLAIKLAKEQYGLLADVGSFGYLR